MDNWKKNLLLWKKINWFLYLFTGVCGAGSLKGLGVVLPSMILRRLIGERVYVDLYLYKSFLNARIRVRISSRSCCSIKRSRILIGLRWWSGALWWRTNLIREGIDDFDGEVFGNWCVLSETISSDLIVSWFSVIARIDWKPEWYYRYLWINSYVLVLLNLSQEKDWGYVDRDLLLPIVHA